MRAVLRTLFLLLFLLWGLGRGSVLETLDNQGRSEVERVKGIEPSSQAWEAHILPLNHTRTQSADWIPRTGACRNPVLPQTLHSFGARSTISSHRTVRAMARGRISSSAVRCPATVAALRHHFPGARVSGSAGQRVSTGASIGHAGLEALDGRPIDKLHDGDCIRLEVSNDLVGMESEVLDDAATWEVFPSHTPLPKLSPHPDLPEDACLWSALLVVGGGI